MSTWLRILVCALLVLSMTACSGKKQHQSLDIERASVVVVAATVTAIDIKTRLVSFRCPDGKVLTVSVGDEVVNLPQVRVGDRVTVSYIESLVVRMAKPGEMAFEQNVLLGTAEPGTKPAGLGMTETTFTADIMEVDVAKETVMLKMPDGTMAVVKARNPENLKKVKAGDTIAVEYTEALAIEIKTEAP